MEQRIAERETSFGTWAFQVGGTVQDKYESRLGPGEEATDYIGFSYGVPKFRQHARLRWNRGNLKATLSASHQQDTINDARYLSDGVWYDYRSTTRSSSTMKYAPSPSRTSTQSKPLLSAMATNSSGAYL